MVQIRQKNKFQMSCMKSVETFFLSSKNNIASNSPETNQKIHPKSSNFDHPPRPVAQKGNTFFVFPRHWESTCWIHFELVSLHLQRCALFLVGRNLAVLGRSLGKTLIETNRSSAVLRKTKLGANYNNVLPQFVFQRKKVWFFRKTPTASFVPSSPIHWWFFQATPDLILSCVFHPRNLRNVPTFNRD